jgi:hypothetical protein
MTKVHIEIYDDVVTVLNKIKSINDTGIELMIPEGSILFESALNLKLLNKETSKYGKVLHLNTQDPYGISLINLINNGHDEEFVAKELDIGDYQAPKAKKSKREINFPKLAFPIPKLKKGSFRKPLLILPVILGLIGFLGYRYIVSVPEAEIKVVVHSQPLTKSLEIKVSRDGQTSAQSSTLKGYAVSTNITKTGTIETTGEKTVGETAKGEIKIFNKTTSEKKFRKGDVVTYNELEFELSGDVTVPARTEDEETLVITPGEATVKVEASEIGEDYNISSGRTMKLDDYDDDDYTARSNNKFEGGKSEVLNVVTEDDKTALLTQLMEEVNTTAENELASQTSRGRKLIKGSDSRTTENEAYNAEVDEEADELELTLIVRAEGLAYSENELNDMLEDLLDDLVPEGFTLSSQDRSISVEILGNSDSTVLNSAEADLQVTIKAFVIPDLKEDELKDELAGKDMEEATRVLGGIKTVSTYEITMNPSIPFISKLPKDPEKINVVVERDEN